MKHPAKFSDDFLPIFADLLKDSPVVLDPMAGTGKIGKIKEHGYSGAIYANDLEIEWVSQSKENGCDIFSIDDAANLKYKEGYFDAICTSPTYGNRMADSHNAKDGSKRNTYTHTLGRKLNKENTGQMQWGEQYREKHVEIYKEIYRVLKNGGILILNVKDHIRKGEVVEVSKFHQDLLSSLGFELQQHLKIPSKGNRFGAHSKLRVDHENIFVFIKSSQ